MCHQCIRIIVLPKTRSRRPLWPDRERVGRVSEESVFADEKFSLSEPNLFPPEEFRSITKKKRYFQERVETQTRQQVRTNLRLISSLFQHIIFLLAILVSSAIPFVSEDVKIRTKKEQILTQELFMKADLGRNKGNLITTNTNIVRPRSRIVLVN